jgi:predicted SPOUT superfamily RNA methylase MTH1
MGAPLKRSFRFAISIPASLISDAPHLREKTFRIGLIGRAAAIFRVDEIIVYPDMPNDNQTLDIKLIQTILSYMETPQYLRKKLFKIMPELQYAGALPPLRTPHHPTANKTENLNIGEYREGFVLSHSKQGSLVDIGVEHPALVQRASRTTNTRVTVKIIDLETKPKAVFVNPKEIKIYWGYKVVTPNTPFVQLVRLKQFDLVIATSRKGKPVTAVLNELRERWKNSRKVLVAFGAPSQGLQEIAMHEHTKLDDSVHFVLNTIPNQATETARTEEAVYATLSILNTLTDD